MIYDNETERFDGREFRDLKADEWEDARKAMREAKLTRVEMETITGIEEDGEAFSARVDAKLLLAALKTFNDFDRVTFFATNDGVQLFQGRDGYAIEANLSGSEDAQGEGFTVDLKDTMRVLRGVKGEILITDEGFTQGTRTIRWARKPSKHVPMPATQGDSIVVSGEALAKCLDASATDQGRYRLDSVALIKEGMCGTDGRRLTMISLNWDHDTRLISPALAKLASRHNVVEVEIDEDNAQKLRADGCVYYSSGPHGLFPDVWSVIPRSLPNTITLPRKQLLDAVQVALKTADAYTRANFIVEAEGVKLQHARFLDRVSCEVVEPAELAFDLRYLERILKTLSTEDVEFSYKDVNMGCIFTNTEGEGYFELVMPLDAKEYADD